MTLGAYYMTNIVLKLISISDYYPVKDESLVYLTTGSNNFGMFLLSAMELL